MVVTNEQLQIILLPSPCNYNVSVDDSGRIFVAEACMLSL